MASVSVMVKTAPYYNLEIAKIIFLGKLISVLCYVALGSIFLEYRDIIMLM